MNRELISAAIGGIRADHITAALRHGRADKHARRTNTMPARRLLTAALAAALLLAAAVTAYAAGLFDSLFSAIPNEFAARTERAWYQRAGELSKKEPETVSLRDLPGGVLTLTESFYDGRDLILAWDLDGMQYPVQFGFGPGDEHFSDLQPVGHWYINAQWEESVPPEDYQRICTLLREEESAGFRIRCAYVGDHVCLSDGTDLGPWAGGAPLEGSVVMEWREWETAAQDPEGGTVVMGQGGLPAEARDREELELVFTVREVLMYYYKDGETLFVFTEPLREEPVTITVPNNGPARKETG